MENDKINYHEAKFSLAMIDFRQHLCVLRCVDEGLEEANFVVQYVENRHEITEDMKSMINNLALPKFCKVKAYIQQVKQIRDNYIKTLEEFLNANPGRKEEFEAMLIELNITLEDVERVIKQQIDKCFKFNKESCENLSV